jgi:NAD(P)-dependent dehydrogenase (short-subunit alcohol dehydrogenase family)
VSKGVTGKIALITGANSGMGKASTAMLADMEYHVVMLCRDETRGRAAYDEITRVGGRMVDLMLCDLGDMGSIRGFVRNFRERFDRLDVLINNAGVITLDLLERSGSGRIVVYSSGAHKMGKVHFDDINLRRRYNVIRSYGQSKLANLYFARELARRLRERGSSITVNACHPGAVATQMGVDRNTGFGKTVVRMMRPFFQTPEQGCRTAIYLATSEEVANLSGEYFYKCKVARTSRRSRDMEAARRLFDISEAICQRTVVEG